jgi:hypothetical protein
MKHSTSVLARRALLSIAAMSAVFATAAQAQSLSLITIPPIGPGSHYVRMVPLDIAIGMGGGVIIGRKDGIGLAVVDGQAVTLRGKSGYTNLQPSAISRNGQIVGTGKFGDQFRGLFWPSYASDPIDMGALTTITNPRGVNSSGVAVGEMIQPLANGGAIRTAFAWSVAGGLRSIAPALSSSSTAHAISDSGFAAGEASFGGPPAAIRWSPGTTQAGVAEFGATALHVKENGTIYNQTTSWNLVNQETHIAPGAHDLVAGISELGRVVGTTIETPQMPFKRAWTQGPGTALRNLPLPPGATDTFATQVDNCGSVLGGAALANGTTQAVFWALSPCDQKPTRR